PEKAPESDMLRAGHLGEKLFGSVGETSQNSLCRELRKCLRSWENDLGMFRKISEKGQYPGRDEIKDGLALTEKLLDFHDPVEFIKAFINDEDRLWDAIHHFAGLKNFFKNQIYTWDTLLRAVEDFNPNRKELEKNHDVKEALDALQAILGDPEPYSMIKNIRDLICIVKPAIRLNFLGIK
ncbi:MAG: hypothetical protein Q8P24_16030, partial [Desulfobacterales bacterium]|nr:hypothetical protein [Desulfobacterales bacterium]